MNMKKIIFIANVDCGDGMSGGSRIYFEFLKNWDKFFDTFFFGSLGTIKRLQKENIKNIKFVEVDDKDKPNLYSIYGVFVHFFRRLVKGILAVIKNVKTINQAEYVYSVSDFYPDLITAWYVKLKNPRIKWIAGYYLFAPKPFSRESLYKGKHRLRGFLYWLMQRPSCFIVNHWADFVFVTNEPDRKKFINTRLSSDKVIAIRGGVDTKTPNLVPETKEKKYDAVFIGRFHSQKGVLELIDIWKIVCEKKCDAKLGLIGIGGLEDQMKNKVKILGLENNIDFLGFKDGVEKFKIFKESKMALYPATLDHWSMAPVEAMSCGLPLVTFNVETLKFLDPKGMVKTPCYNLEDFAKAIIELLNNKVLYEKTKIDAIAWANGWDWDKRAEEIFNKIK